jgi:hypothetical protein
VAVRKLAGQLGDRTNEPPHPDPFLAGKVSDRRLMEPLRRMLLEILDGPEGTGAAEQVTVSLQDLVTVLGEAEGFIGSKDNAAFTRLAEAAGVS